MSKLNALTGLISSYGDTDDDSDDAMTSHPRPTAGLGVKRKEPLSHGHHQNHVPTSYIDPSSAIQPAPIPHCPWSACYDENSGFTYYWNQLTNAVTWEAPPEYLLAVKLAQQHLHSSGSTEVSAEEWMLYQQALAEKQFQGSTKVITKPPVVKPKKPATVGKVSGKRSLSEDDDVKIELITSYHNSDSESNDEADSPKPPVPAIPPKTPKNQVKKQKKFHQKTIEYGPPLPPNQNYTAPIGPQLPPEFVAAAPKPPENKVVLPVAPVEEVKKSNIVDNEDSQDENLLLTKLKDQAMILQKLGGDLPEELQKIIEDETNSKPGSPKVGTEISKENNNVTETNIDDLLEEIEKKELPKVVKSKNIMETPNELASIEGSPVHSPKTSGTGLSDEIKPLFPSSKNISEETTLFIPGVSKIQENGVDKDKEEKDSTTEKKGNLYLMDTGDVLEKTNRKKLRISNSVLPVKKSETPSYTTKYSESIDGFTGERTGLGFSKDDGEESPKSNAVSYGNGLVFTKGETLNEEKKDEDLDDLTDLLDAKLKYLNQLQPCVVTPVQEMLIQMQTLGAAFRAGALGAAYWRRWAAASARTLARHELAAAPPGWLCAFQRSEGRYRYERESDGLVQWEYPAVANMDMDICTTPPHPGIDAKDDIPPTPPATAPPLPPPPPPVQPSTPPPPTWEDPPPPGCDHAEPPPPPPETKQEIGDELLSFYNDIAELEKQAPPAAPAAPATPAPAAHAALPAHAAPPALAAPPAHAAPPAPTASLAPAAAAPAPVTAPPPPPAASPEPPPLPPDTRDKHRDRDGESKTKKKTKVKISSSMGMKHKSVSSLVAKWQQVADEINSE